MSTADKNTKDAMLQCIEAWRKRKLSVAQRQEKAISGFVDDLSQSLIDKGDIVRMQYKDCEIESPEVMPCIL